jgi:hypothetical protein
MERLVAARRRKRAKSGSDINGGCTVSSRSVTLGILMNMIKYLQVSNKIGYKYIYSYIGNKPSS